MADGNLPSSVGLFFWLQAVCGARSCPEAAAREQAADTPHLQVELVRKQHGSQNAPGWSSRLEDGVSTDM